MGALVLVARLALRDLRRRRAEALILLIALTATTTTLALGRTVGGAADRPWERTRAATAGPDAVATSERVADLAALAHAPGVTASAGPYAMVSVDDLRVRNVRVAAVVQGRDGAGGPVDRPEVTSGTWARRGGVVVERAFATALKVRPGDALTIAGRRLTVAGVAVTAGRVPYPSSTPGLVWATRADLRRLGRPVTSHVMPLRLADPAAAPAFAAAHHGVRTWQDMGSYATAELHLVDRALMVGTWALALLAVACVTVLVGGRLADQTRRVGLLKAVGATPRIVAAVLLAEYVVLAVAASAAGLVAGWTAAPLLARPSAGLAGGGRPGLTAGTAVLVLAVAVLVTGAATAVPAVRGTRMSTVRALAGPARAPRRSAGLIRLSARLPVPLLIGLRLAARRPRRSALALASLAVTAAMVVAAIALHGDIARKDAGATGPMFVPGAENPVTRQVNDVVLIMTLALLLLAAVNAVLIAWAGSVDARRPGALVRALGATPGQVTAGLSAAQLFPAALAGALGIPLGLVVYAAARAAAGVPGGNAIPYAWLPAVIPGTIVAVALLTALPARLSGRRPIAEALRAE
ncbi:FtsX-like permease family protein [Actinoallomurus rhizosphaericola]|uniref:FtsX-like permease family protein n=1 Tax=Actinoallomurus rhizosphaericola TaxID=2952536 RepID=UPI0020903CDC|nr:ABC transporter permease [Actinoallomurus rhizosphaericola]MCO5993727.1 ABC transporter permease [Actinoallomurus rhizosphaericola]